MMLIDEEETRNASRHQIEVIPFTIIIITMVKYNYNENKVDVDFPCREEISPLNGRVK